MTAKMFAAISRRVIKIYFNSNNLRLCHSHTDPFNLHNMQIIKTFDKTVDPFSKIHIETPMNIKIEPIDLQQNPDGNRLVLNLFSHIKDTSSEFTIKQTAKRIDLVGNKALPDTDAVCVIHAPVRASFDIQATGNSSIFIDKMHSDECNLKTISGMVKLKDVRGQNLKISSNEGSVNCQGTILAEKIDIKTNGNADVIFQHVRSNNLKIATNGGIISTDSCYSDESHFTTVVGSIKLANVHRHCIVEILERGDLTMTGFDGTLKAILKRGNIHLQASKLYASNSVFIHESGLVDISLSNIRDQLSLMELIGKKIVIEDDILNLGKVLEDQQHQKFRYEDERQLEELHELYVENRNGTIEMKILSWKDMVAREIKSDKY